MAVDGIEIAVGQVWRCRDGELYRVAEHDAGDTDYPWLTQGVSDSGPGFWLTDTGLDYEGHKSEGDLIQLVTDEHGFTIWRGGEQPAETKGQLVSGRLRDAGVFSGTEADELRWDHYDSIGDIVAYKLVAADKKLEWPALADPVPEVQLELPGVAAKPDTGEYTGGSVSYYKVFVDEPLSGGPAYTAECNDIIEALDMNWAEANVFKANWRRAAARKFASKRGYDDGLYDAEKMVFFSGRVIAQQRKGGV